MLQRHVPAKRRQSAGEEPIALGTRIALWKCVRRDQRFLSHSSETIERLALRLHVRAARARLRAGPCGGTQSAEPERRRPLVETPMAGG